MIRSIARRAHLPGPLAALALAGLALAVQAQPQSLAAQAVNPVGDTAIPAEAIVIDDMVPAAWCITTGDATTKPHVLNDARWS